MSSVATSTRIHLRNRLTSGLAARVVALFVALFVAIVISPGAAISAPLPGADSKALAQAVSAWLDDDDPGSLPALSQLARRGNVAAALLVARIERTTKHSSDWLHALAREKRLALFRRPSRSPFAPTWIGWYANKGQDLALAFENAGLSRTGAHLVHALVELGEPQAADTLIRRIAFYGDGQQRAQVAGANLPLPELAPYVDAMDRPAADSRLGLNALIHLLGRDALRDLWREDIESAASYLQHGWPFSYLSSSHPLHDLIAQRVAEVPALQPIKNQCASICPNDSAKCSVAMIGLQGGYYDTIRIDSPLESVISQQQFLASKRASGMALRRAALARDGAATGRASGDTIWQYSQCLAIAVNRVRNNSVRLFR